MKRGAELLRMTVYGQPAGAGSKTAEVVTHGRGGPIVWANGPKILPGGKVIGMPMLRYRPASKFTGPWMRELEKQAEIAWRGATPLDGPLWVLVDSWESRPRGHFRTGQYAHLLKPDAPAHPDTTDTHDSGKMRRAAEDALTNARIWADDKRVVDGHDRKHYCDPEATILEGEAWREPRQLIRVGRMLHATVEEAGITSPAPAGQEQLIAA